MRNQAIPKLAAASAVIAVGLTAASLTVAVPVQAQMLRPTAPLPSFEVATIKLRGANSRAVIRPLGTGDEVQIGGTARSLVSMAFGLQVRSQLIGGEGWTDQDVYIVQAKIGADDYARMQTMTAAERKRQAQLMLQSLLVERFKLKVRLGKREMPVYELIVDKNGAKLPEPNDPKGSAAGGFWAANPSTGEMSIRNVKLDELLALPMFGLVDRPIVNKTGFTGTYNLKLTWLSGTRDQGSSTTQAPASVGPSEGDSVFTMVKEQLGLRIVSATDPVVVLYIEDLQRPSEN